MVCFFFSLVMVVRKNTKQHMPSVSLLVQAFLAFALWLHLLLFTVVWHVVLHHHSGVRCRDAVVESVVVLLLCGLAVAGFYWNCRCLYLVASLPIVVWHVLCAMYITGVLRGEGGCAATATTLGPAGVRDDPQLTRKNSRPVLEQLFSSGRHENSRNWQMHHRSSHGLRPSTCLPACEW